MKAKNLVGGIVNNVRNIINADTDLVLKATDQEVVITRTAATVITVPLGLEVGKTFTLYDMGAGRVTVVGQTVGLNSVSLVSESTTFVSTGQYGVIRLAVVAANTVVVSGSV